MLQALLAPIMAALAALGIGGTSAGATAAIAAPAIGGALTAGSLAGGAGGLASGLSGLTAGATPAANLALAPSLGAAAALPSAPGFFASMFPNAAKFGTSAMTGDWKGAGGALGNMAGSPNLANMIENPSWGNAGTLGKDLMNPANPLSPLSQGKQQPMAMPSPQTRSQAPQTDDPILQQMYKNFNPQQTRSGMKPWPPSPYPRKMSAI